MAQLTKRSSHLQFLHPLMRQAAEDVVEHVRCPEFAFKIFETYRSPERQVILKKKRPKVTNAGPWQSMHQYGLAVDFVIDVKGVGMWSTKHGRRKWWDALHEAGRKFGLRHLVDRKGRTMELPHMQMVGCSWQACHAGEYPPGGDDPWVFNIHRTAARFRRRAPLVLPKYAPGAIESLPAL